MATTLNACFEDLVKAKRVPAAGAIIIDKTGNELYNASFGTTNASDHSAPRFTADTQLLLFSCTKLVTAICFLQLLEQGKIDSIHDPVSKYHPRIAEFQVCDGLEADGTPKLRKPKTEMRLVHLLTHTSGLTYDFWEGEEPMFKYRQEKDQPPGQMLGISAEWQYFDGFLAFDPGSKFHYGLSYDHLGLLVETVSGMKIEEYMQRNIFDVLGMEKTGPGFGDEAWLQVHAKGENGAITAVEAVQPTKTPWRYGGGHFLVSTLSDWSRVLGALVNGGASPVNGARILREETVSEYVFRDLIGEVECARDRIGRLTKSLLPGLCNEGDFGRTLAEGDERGWTAGLMMNQEDAPGARKAGSGAWAGLSNVYYWIDPKQGVAGVMASAILPFLDEDCLDLFEKVEKFAYA